MKNFGSYGNPMKFMNCNVDKTGSVVGLVSRGSFVYQLHYIMWIFITATDE